MWGLWSKNKTNAFGQRTNNKNTQKRLLTQKRPFTKIVEQSVEGPKNAKEEDILDI